MCVCVGGAVKQTVGGLVLTPVSASQPCSCSPALSLTSPRVLLKHCLHHGRSNPCHAEGPPPRPPPSHLSSGQNTRSTSRAESVRRTASGHSGNWEDAGSAPARWSFPLTLSQGGKKHKQEDFLTSRRPSNVLAEEPCNHPTPSKLPLMS